MSDSIPERRNLLVISIAFIVYYGAGGSIASDKLRLMALNIEFDRPAFISITAWALLFWFALRFFQKVGFSAWGNIKSEIVNADIPERLMKSSEEATRRRISDGLINMEGSKIRASHISMAEGSWGIVCNCLGESTRVIFHQETIPINGLSGLAYRAYFVFKAVLSENAFSEHFVPYVALAAAVFAPVWSVAL